MIKNVVLEIDAKEFKQFSFEYKKEKWLIDVIIKNDLREYWLQNSEYGLKQFVIGLDCNLSLENILNDILFYTEHYKRTIDLIELEELS